MGCIVKGYMEITEFQILLTYLYEAKCTFPTLYEVGFPFCICHFSCGDAWEVEFVQLPSSPNLKLKR